LVILLSRSAEIRTAKMEIVLLNPVRGLGAERVNQVNADVENDGQALENDYKGKKPEVKKV
jgi:hypothetical protein